MDRYNSSIGQYTMIKHEREPLSNPINPCRYKLLAVTHREWEVDGLNSLQYKLLNIMLTPLYTHILVDLLEDEERPITNKLFC
ncbi:hypothetical protein ANCDUO_20894 [Ancylostoma duodenale]|uniref:Uncharacterized protein n=1 Tax=Ancylostoma duodenale TaxID=51022 RepID=A0A0C2CGW5_9BILA|nr:hypothetical protein ANCDUO_20894 [Ancylostoma duodenale]